MENISVDVEAVLPDGTGILTLKVNLPFTGPEDLETVAARVGRALRALTTTAEEREHVARYLLSQETEVDKVATALKFLKKIEAAGQKLDAEGR